MKECDVTSFKRKTVLVTGGTRGIGRAIVHRLVTEGWHVAFTYREKSALADDLVAILQARSAPDQQIQAYCTDLADGDAVEVLPGNVVRDFGQLDALVNNAGMTDDGAFLAMDASRWERLLHTNFVGSARLCLQAIPALLEQRESAIVMVASLASLTGKEGQVPYATTKGALIGLTQSLGFKYGSQGLRVNAVAPGFIRTEMIDVLEPRMYEHILMGTALHRMGEADEVAGAINFLLQPGYLQSTTLRLDGGFKR